MKYLLFSLLVLLSITSAFSIKNPKKYTEISAMGTIPFITTWKTDNPGTSGPNQITIPGTGNNYTVDWGDGNITTETGAATHTYATSGTYIVSITGDFPSIFFNGGGDRQKLITIEQWGDNPWSSMSAAFSGCVNLVGNFTDVPDLSNVTDMSFMFQQCTLFNSPINNWDVSNVTLMNNLFNEADSFNQDIGNWNTSNVTTMSQMFYGTDAFNQNIGNWNTSNVTDMFLMFFGTAAFNQDINFKPGAGIPSGDAWNTTNVTNMSGMFWGALVFNENISDWNLSNVTSTSSMFQSAAAFNQDIGAWNMGNVINAGQMFQAASAFNQDIGLWNTSNVQNFGLMFQNATSFNQDIGSWNVSSATDVQRMFFMATNFNQDLSLWNVENVTNADRILASTSLSTANYDAILIGWNTQNLQPNVLFGVGNIKFCDGAAARANMEALTGDNWTIIDGGPASPTVNDLIDQNNPNSYTLPAITGTNLTGAEAYFTGTNGTGTQYNATDVINYADFATYPQTLYIYDGAGSCSSQEEFNLTITNPCTPPIVNDLVDQNVADSYTLPTITGTNLTGAEAYFTGTNGTGMQYNATDVINYADFATYPQTLYIYDGAGSCSSQEEFNLTITNPCTPLTVNDLVDQNVADSYTLPTITGTNLTGAEAYYTGSNGTGTQYNATNVINYADFVTYPQTLYIYDSAGSCSDEENFLLTITSNCNTPIADNLANITECNSYILPILSPDNFYYTESNAGGVQLYAGDTIDTTETIYIHTGTNDCSNENNFTVTIDVTICEDPTDFCEVIYPKFFTPNADGFNDFFELQQNSCNLNGTISIYDRYGKLFFQNKISDNGWDGFFLGAPVSSSDYWFKVNLEDGRIFKGHFALKR